MKVKNFFAMMFAATAFVACNNEEIPNGGIDGENGEDTWAAFSIQLPKTAVSRAADATNATEAETAVQNVALYVQQLNKPLLTSGIKTLAEFSKDVVNGENVYKANIAIKARKGAAKVWVVVNPTAEMHSAILGFVPTEAFHSEFAATVAGMAGGYTNTAQTGVTGTGFVMANHAAKEVMLVDVKTEKDAVNDGVANDDKNHFTVEVERAVAKVAVISTKEKLEDLNTLKEQGTLSDIKYYVAQVNEKTLMARNTNKDTQSGGANIVTPGNNNDGTSIFGTNALQGAPISINASNLTGKGLNSIYALENSMLSPYQQNATHAVIVATWTPKVLYTADGNVFTGSYTTGQDFWFYESRYYVAAPTGVADSDKYKWTAGKCYYRVYLYNKYGAKNEKFYDVVRNTIYNVNIASIKAPGENSPVPPGPGPDDIEEDVWVTANVDILPWSSANMDDVDLN